MIITCAKYFYSKKFVNHTNKFLRNSRFRLNNTILKFCVNKNELAIKENNNISIDNNMAVKNIIDDSAKQSPTLSESDEDNKILLSIDTILATSGCEVSDISTGAVTPPIHLSTTFERDENLELSKGFCYSRSSNPTRQLLEKTFAKLENGKEAFAFSSGNFIIILTIIV